MNRKISRVFGFSVFLITAAMAGAAAAATVSSGGGCSGAAVAGAFVLDEQATVPSVTLPRSIAKTDPTSVKNVLVNGPITVEINRGIGHYSERTAPYPHGEAMLSLNYFYLVRVSYDLENARIPATFGWSTSGKSGLKAVVLINNKPAGDFQLTARCLHCGDSVVTATSQNVADLIKMMPTGTPLELAVAIHDDKGNWDSRFGANYLFCITLPEDWNPTTF